MEISTASDLQTTPIYRRESLTTKICVTPIDQVPLQHGGGLSRYMSKNAAFEVVLQAHAYHITFHIQSVWAFRFSSIGNPLLGSTLHSCKSGLQQSAINFGIGSSQIRVTGNVGCLPAVVASVDVR